MRRIFFILTIGLLVFACSKAPKESQLKPFLMEQLKYSYAEQNWYVPPKIAIEGLTFEQAIWQDSTENHSIIENVSHMIFWNERVLRTFNGEEVSDYTEANQKTFLNYSESDWTKAVNKLDSVQTAWAGAVENASAEQLEEWGIEIANMAGHNAYHTGQIIYIRKRNGWWK